MNEAAFDELIHAPLRLQICAMLSPVRWLAFSDIRDSLEISDSVLSKHLSALAGAGYVEVSRVRADSRSRRQVTLTKPGRTAYSGTWRLCERSPPRPNRPSLRSRSVPVPGSAAGPVERSPSILGSRRKRIVRLLQETRFNEA